MQPYVVIGADAVVGDHCQIQNHTDIGHDCVLGAFNRIDCKVMCVGGESWQFCYCAFVRSN